jgi:hypothetical protein
MMRRRRRSHFTHVHKKLFIEIFDLFAAPFVSEVRRTFITSFPGVSIGSADPFAPPFVILPLQNPDVPIRGGERGQVERVKTLGRCHALFDLEPNVDNNRMRDGVT